jgi:ribosome biogenesis GTPase / thiamine phosphate phosphatase
MELEDIGFDDWFRKGAKISSDKEGNFARIVAVDKNRFVIKNEEFEIPAELIGKIIYNADSNLDLPTVGDWVKVKYYDNNTFALIHEILPRKTILKRKMAGNKIDYQLIAANIDTAFIIQSSDNDFNIARLERYLTMINESNIRPIVMLSKIDLIEPDKLKQRIDMIKSIGHDCRIIVFSNKTGQGLSEIINSIKPGKTYCLLGSSGVGKTTLLNNLIGKDLYATDIVRKKNGKGRHITTRRHLIVLKNGGLFIDTPGLRELASIEAFQGFDATFKDIFIQAKNCRFSDCTHSAEPGCAVLDALAAGNLDKRHYQNFLKLRKELEYNQRTYLEKRKKDKSFGKMCKQAMKNNKKI